MTTIRIDESADQKESSVAYLKSNTDKHVRKLSRGAGDDDGIYNIRSKSQDRSNTHDDAKSYMSSDDEDPGLGIASDFKQKQVFNKKMLLWLTYQSIGVIYGDIGTSPLYTYSSTFTSAPSHQDLVGVLSLIIWSLTMMVTVKYVFIVLRADNNGEGGTFSTYSLLSRYMNITHKDPKQATFIEMRRHASSDLESAGRNLRKGFESSKFARGLLKVIGLLSVTMIISDGVLTPAQSVLGAVQGIEVVTPNISRGIVVGVTDAILVLLFLIQPFGITKITVAFSPIVIIWLGVNFAFGAYNLAHHDASVFKAFNPGFAFEFLIRNKERGWRALGGVLLSFTGLEALFADLGAFSRTAVQLSWLCYTFPCVLMGYIGQAAYISDFPEAYSNPFFNAAPPGTIYPALVIAILAAIVASQAIITATFQLLSFMMKLSYFPQIKVYHTSKIFHGQLYIPVANWLLMIGTILVATLYKNTTALGQAYGVCVMFVTFFDTCMVSLVAIFVWRLHPLIVVGPWLTIACMDGAFISAALIKVPNGAWFTLTLAIVLALMLLVWRYGKEQQWIVESQDRYPTSHFVRARKDGSIFLADRYNGSSISTIQGLGIFFDKAGEMSPMVFSQFVLKLTAIPEVVIFFHLRPLDVPSVQADERFSVSRLALPNCYRLVVRYGFSDEFLTDDPARVIYQQIRRYLLIKVTDIDKDGASVPEDKQQQQLKEKIGDLSSTGLLAGQINGNDDLTTLDKAYNHKVLFMLGKEELKVGPYSASSNSKFSFQPKLFIRTVLLNIFVYVRDNTRNKMASIKVPMDKVIEVGFLKEL